MGVHTLWDILAPTGQNDVPVRDLQGQTLAVDISGWLVELSQSKASENFRNVYLRNLYYRTIAFLKDGVRLLVVMDGRAPELKQEALITRQKNQYGTVSTSPNLDRRQLNKTIIQCKELFQCFGIPCIQSDGEAEAMCAWLNKEGFVDGCLTDDNDFFCYGGRKLCKNLRKENGIYKVDIFEASKIKEETGMVQRDFVGLSLLLGCDFGLGGVKSIGKEKGMELFRQLKDKDIDLLTRLEGWKENKDLEEIERRINTDVKNQSHCKKCDHLGRVNIHETSGCQVCATTSDCRESCDITCPCDWHEREALKRTNKLEIGMRRKSLEDENFPNKEIIKEYLQPKLSAVTKEEILESTMNIRGLIEFMRTRLGWSCDKVLDKLVPMVICKEVIMISNKTENKESLMFAPIRIKRTCKEHHVECYEVVWDRTDKNNWTSPTYSTNIEVKLEKSVFAQVYPHIVSEFEMACQAKQKSTGKRKKDPGEKGQMKMTAFTKVKKKLDFNETKSENIAGSLSNKLNVAGTEPENQLNEPSGKMTPCQKAEKPRNIAGSSKGIKKYVDIVDSDEDIIRDSEGKGSVHVMAEDEDSDVDFVNISTPSDSATELGLSPSKRSKMSPGLSGMFEKKKKATDSLSEISDLVTSNDSSFSSGEGNKEFVKATDMSKISLKDTEKGTSELGLSPSKKSKILPEISGLSNKKMKSKEQPRKTNGLVISETGIESIGGRKVGEQHMKETSSGLPPAKTTVIATEKSTSEQTPAKVSPGTSGLSEKKSNRKKSHKSVQSSPKGSNITDTGQVYAKLKQGSKHKVLESEGYEKRTVIASAFDSDTERDVSHQLCSGQLFTRSDTVTMVPAKSVLQPSVSRSEGHVPKMLNKSAMAGCSSENKEKVKHGSSGKSKRDLTECKQNNVITNFFKPKSKDQGNDLVAKTVDFKRNDTDAFGSVNAKR